MRKALLALVMAGTAGAFAAGPARAQGGLGLGVILGEPTGLSLKAWMSHTTAFDLAVAWSTVDEPAVDIHGDYLFHDYDLFHVDRGQLPVYYGLGARLKFLNHDSQAGVRAPVGVEYLFESAKVGLFMELAPILDLAPDTGFHLNGAVGARYYLR